MTKIEKQSLPDELMDLLSCELNEKNSDISKDERKAAFTVFKQHLLDNNINLCQVATNMNYSLFGFLFIQHDFYKKLIIDLLPLIDVNKKPEGFLDHWISAAATMDTKLIKALGKYDTACINDFFKSTWLGTGTPIGIMTNIFYDKNKKSTQSLNYFKRYYIDSEKLLKFVNGPLSAMLDLGANPNGFFVNNNNDKIHITAPVLNNLTVYSETYTTALNKYIQSGFDYNQIFDYETKDNYLQYLLKSAMSQKIDILNTLFKSFPVDSEYKNKKNQTVSDLIESLDISTEIKSLIEQKLLSQKIPHINSPKSVPRF